MIGFPSSLALKPAVDASADPERPDSGRGGYEEWGYAEREWYVEGRQGSGGTVRALLWPTTGVVEVARYDRRWAARTPQPPADLFLFHVTEAGLLRLRRHLLSTLASDEPTATADRSAFYPSRRRYHFLHHCHHYIARALREAGLPVSPVWAMSRGLLSMQLDRAERLAAYPGGKTEDDIRRVGVSRLRKDTREGR
jgi:hypothetical protein